MAFNYSRLADVTTLSDSAAAVYTNPSSTTSYVRVIMLHNTNSSTESVKIYQVPDVANAVGTASNANKIYEEVLNPNDTRIIEIEAPGLMLTDENDTIQGESSTASKVVITITGGTE